MTDENRNSSSIHNNDGGGSSAESHHPVLPSLEVCLFGAKRKCPRISSSSTKSSTQQQQQQKSSPSLGRFFEQQQQDDDRNHPTNDHDDHDHSTLADETAVVSEAGYDSIMDNSRWGVVASQHDINMPQLRKLSSQGVPDECSWRGVAWRVLLGFLPTQDIERSWIGSVPDQRSFYLTLVEQYVHVSPSDLNGRELRGHLSKTLRNRQLRSNYNRVGSLNDSSHHHSLVVEEEEQDHEPQVGNANSNNEQTASNVVQDDDEDLIDACIRHGSLQSFQSKLSEAAEATALATAAEVAAFEAAALIKESTKDDDDVIDNNSESQNQEYNSSEHSFSDRALYDESDSALHDTNNHSFHSEMGDSSSHHLSETPLRNKTNNNNVDSTKKFKSNPNSSMEIDATDDDQDIPFLSIADQLPSQFREEWIASGMNSLDHRPSTLKGSFSVASLAAINRLVVPAPLVEAARREQEQLDSSSHHKQADKPTNESSRGNDDDDDDEQQQTPNNDSSSALSSTSSSSTPATPPLDQIFRNFLLDAQSLEQIRKDVVRTHQDLRFYLEPDQNLGVRRCAALERILYIWGKLNKGVRYVQGMNEIVGTLYYVLANDLNSDWSNAAEADTYYLFQTILLEFQDVFMPELDDTSTGIHGRMSNLERLLHTHDPSIQAHLNDVGIDASFYALRWLSTLLSREFLLPDTIRLWDSMFSSTHKENFLRYVCATMVMMIRDDLLKTDLAGCLRLLQSYPPTNMDDILEASKALWLYESQITLAVTKGGISLQQALQTIRPPPSIIFAFGLAGGVPPPTVSEVVQEKAQQTAAAAAGRAGQATTRLVGRARKIWNGWGSSASSVASTLSENNTDAPDSTVTAQQQDSTVTKVDRVDSSSDRLPSDSSRIADIVPPSQQERPMSRFWNRGRSGSASSSVASNQSISPFTPSPNVLTADEVPVTDPIPALPGGPTTSRFWNRK